MFKWDINKEARRIAKEISDHFEDYITKYKNIAKQIFDDWNEGRLSSELKKIYQLHDREIELAKFFLISDDPRELDLLEELDWFSSYNAWLKDAYEFMDDCILYIQEKKKELKKLERKKTSRIRWFKRAEHYIWNNDDTYYYWLEAYWSMFLKDKKLNEREKKSFYAKLVSMEFNKLDLSYATEYKEKNKLNYFNERTIDCSMLKLFVEWWITYEALMTLTYKTSC